ncbi:MAG: carboxypeptidase regulatory-like domain-containing protein [Bacteroidota bacterium]
MSIRILLLIVTALVSGCVGDAPRDNPLDPLSSSYPHTGNVSGRVVLANQGTGIAGAVISEEALDISVTSDSLGYFSFSGLSSGNHRFVCSKMNFDPDTFDVSIISGEQSTVTCSLNSAPVVVSQNILSRKIDQYFPSPQYFVDVSAEVTDPNGIADLDSVWFNVDTLKFPMTYSVTSKNFLVSIYKNQFPTNTIQWLVGKALHIISKDRNAAVNISDPFYVSRVIENTASPIYPSSVNNDTTGSYPVFRWSPPDVTFNYSYSIVVSRVDGGTQTVVWNYAGLNSIYEEISFPRDGTAVPLQSGNYLWTVSVVDDFGNYARSKESSFVVN